MTAPSSPNGTGGDELELLLEEVDAPDALPTPCTLLGASIVRSLEELTPRETKRRRSTTRKCSPLTTFGAKGRGMTGRL